MQCLGGHDSRRKNRRIDCCQHGQQRHICGVGIKLVGLNLGLDAAGDGNPGHFKLAHGDAMFRKIGAGKPAEAHQAKSKGEGQDESASGGGNSNTANDAKPLCSSS